MEVHRIQRTKRARTTPIRSKIIDYLESHGASKVADISDGIASSRGAVRYHLAALESASIVRSNISPRCQESFHALLRSRPWKNGARLLAGQR
ncbi:winged helix-turn-helix domain-containing protein [Arthrobacter sp. NicSoilC12]|uniref:winged helix-turn-helix domain-containing protein n=1 Tax=Arthrobacter sp. NicSoilC12 TaxID=2831001 RepID=UPI001CC35375